MVLKNFITLLQIVFPQVTFIGGYALITQTALQEIGARQLILS